MFQPLPFPWHENSCLHVFHLWIEVSRTWCSSIKSYSILNLQALKRSSSFMHRDGGPLSAVQLLGCVKLLMSLSTSGSVLNFLSKFSAKRARSFTTISSSWEISSSCSKSYKNSCSGENLAISECPHRLQNHRCRLQARDAYVSLPEGLWDSGFLLSLTIKPPPKAGGSKIKLQRWTYLLLML